MTKLSRPKKVSNLSWWWWSFPRKKVMKKMDGRTKAFSRFKMHECKKSKLEKKWTRCDVDDAILNEYRWLGSSPRQEEEEKKLLQSVAMQWWKSSLMAFWSRFFFSLNEATPHPQTFFAFESWTVDIIVFESWHELFIFNLCFCITTKTARLLPFMKREREKKQVKDFP